MSKFKKKGSGELPKISTASLPRIFSSISSVFSKYCYSSIILFFAKKAKSFGIDAIEYVSGLYTNHTDTLEKMSMSKLG